MRNRKSLQMTNCIMCNKNDVKGNMEYLVVRKYPRGTKEIYVHRSCIKFTKDKES